MIPAILIAVGAIIAALIVIVTLQPAEFGIARSTTIAAPPAVAFSQVNDFHNWDAWSPWARLDPAARNSFEGAPAGTGAVFTWAGNKKVGEGRMTIMESRLPELIRIKLEFRKPFKATNVAEFTFTPQGDQTLVTWAMSGQKNLMFKAVHLLVNMDKMVGADFEKGLAQMKTVVESKS